MRISNLTKEQERLSKKIVTKDDFDEISTLAGCDFVFTEDKIIAAIILMQYPKLKILEKQYSVKPIAMVYKKGYLAYRVLPAIMEAFNKLDAKPDLLIIPGNGILHPRKIGLASHAGLLLDTPSIGVSKTLAYGEEKGPKIFIEEEVRGQTVKTKEFSNPLYISIGHRVSLKTCLTIVKETTMENHKFPEPIHQAHKFAIKIRKDLER